MTSDNPFVELTWRGQRVGRVKLDAPTAGAPGFLYHEAPLPVGAVLEVAVEGGTGAKRVRVVGVVEQEGGRDGQPPPPPGMKVVWVEPAVPPPIPADVAAGPAEVAVAGVVAVAEAAPEEVKAETTDPTAGTDPTAAKPKRTRRKPTTGDPRPPRLGGKGSKKKT